MSDTGNHKNATGARSRFAGGERLRSWLRRERGLGLGLPSTTRLGVTAAVAALVTMTAIVAAVVAANPADPRAAKLNAVTLSAGTPNTGTPNTGTLRGTASAAIARANAVPATLAGRGQGGLLAGELLAMTAARIAARAAAVPLVLTAVDHRDCPAKATVCVDLTRHITWLQASGKTTFGPVQMEPGKPGSHHQTPRGTFQVEWKAGPAYVSNLYHEPMPWATFFAPGGIAFHGGSLTQWSHGCVHLTIANAHYYNEHLPVGATVVVF